MVTVEVLVSYIFCVCYHFPASVPAISLTGGESAGVKNGIILAAGDTGPHSGDGGRQFKLIMAKQSH